MICCHRRSDQLDRPDHINSPINPDQAGLNAHSRLLLDLKSTLHDVLRLLLDDNPTKIPTSSRSLIPIRESYTISTRLTGPLLDRCQISTQPDRNDRNRVVNNDRVNVEMIVYRSGKRCYPTKLDRYTIYSRSTRSSTRSLYDRFSTRSLLEFLNM
jgi:hypothetical protein